MHKNANKIILINDPKKIFFLIVLLVIIITFALLNKNFLTYKNIIMIFKHASIMAIAALGLTYVIIVGHTDISFYLVACFSSMAMSWMISLGSIPIISILVGIIAGLFFGFVSGVAVGVLKLPDVIVTLAMGSIGFGAAYIFSDGMYIYKNFLTSGISQLNESRIVGIPLPVIIMLTLYLFSYLFLEKTIYGRRFYSTGINKTASYFSGINVKRVIIIAFIISAVFASISTMITTAAKGSGDVKTGLTLLMPCFTAVYIGHAIFNRFGVVGTFCGVIVLSIMLNGFNIMGATYYFGDLITSIGLIVAILFSNLNKISGSKAI